MSESNNRLTPPEETGFDKAHSVAKGVISSVPVVGGVGAEVFSMIFRQPIVRRTEEWMNDVASFLHILEEQVEGFSIESLSENEEFVTTLAHASQIAMRNHHQEKLEALRNAVLNVALPDAPDADLQLMFLEFVDTLTTWHIRTLQLFHDPEAWEKQHGKHLRRPSISSSLSQLLYDAYPELHAMDDFSRLLAKDLYARGLLNTDHINTMMTADGAFQSSSTEIGKQFLRFITSPL